jgi:hypothetical protein
MMNWKGFKGSGRVLILIYYPGIRLEGLRKTTKNLSEDSLSSARNSNPEPPEYEAGVMITPPRRSVSDPILYDRQYDVMFEKQVTGLARRLV